jgi:ankyrin repeat protein
MTAELLIKKGASLNALTDEELTPLHYAAFGGNSETVTLLIQKGACVNTPETLDTSLSPLFMAVSC